MSISMPYYNANKLINYMTISPEYNISLKYTLIKKKLIISSERFFFSIRRRYRRLAIFIPSLVRVDTN